MTKIIKLIAHWIILLFSYVGIATGLFILANFLVARHIGQPSGSSDTVFHRILGPESPDGIAVLKRVFGAKSDKDALARAQLAPSFEMHPDLHYMTARVNNDHYRIGLEGIRYDAGWTDEVVRKRLASSGAIYLFGGSTMMGHGVSGNETISWYLDQPNGKSEIITLNFGAQAYDFQRATEKLAYLLRIGYRPGKVVFLIGWNEIVGSARSNFRWQDKVIFHGFSVNRGEVAYTPGTAQVNYGKLFAESLPIVQYIRGNQTLVCPSGVNPARDPFVDGFDFREAHCQFNDWEDFAESHRDLLWEQVRTSFQAHTAFVAALSKAFGFDAIIVFQPMGLFDPKNPFVPARARESKSYKYLEMLQRNIREEIRTGRLNIIDGTNWLEGLKSDRHVDIAHYSPNANRELANRLNAFLR